jgi:hypothetical protein
MAHITTFPHSIGQNSIHMAHLTAMKAVYPKGKRNGAFIFYPD